MACPPLPPRLRLDRYELTGDWHRDRLGFVYLTKDGRRLRELAPPGAERQGVRVNADQGDFLERGRRLGFEPLDLPEGLYWVTPDPPGEPVAELSPDLLAQLAEVLGAWHQQGLGHGALTLSCLRVHEGRLTLLDPLGDAEGDLEALQSLSGGGSGPRPLAWAAHARTAHGMLEILRLRARPPVAPYSGPPCPQPQGASHRGWVRCLAFRGCELFSGGEDKLLQGPDFTQDLGAWVCALAAWGSRLVAVTQEGDVIEAGATLGRGAAPALAFSPQGRLVLARSTGKVAGFGMHPTPVNALAFSPDGQLLGVAAGTTVTLWTASGQQLERRETGPLRALAFLSDGRLVTAGSTLLIMDLYGSAHAQLAGPTRCVAPGASGFASADAEKRVWWHPLPLFEPVSLLGQHTGEISALAVSPDERWVASGGQDQTVRVWAIPVR